MSRAWRIEYEGALYHLLSRGNEGNDIFVDERDRDRFLDKIEETSQRFEVDVFCLCSEVQSLSHFKRDILLYYIWQAGQLGDEQIGNPFGIS